MPATEALFTSRSAAHHRRSFLLDLEHLNLVVGPSRERDQVESLVAALRHLQDQSLM